MTVKLSGGDAGELAAQARSYFIQACQHEVEATQMKGEQRAKAIATVDREVANGAGLTLASRTQRVAAELRRLLEHDHDRKEQVAANQWKLSQTTAAGVLALLDEAEAQTVLLAEIRDSLSLIAANTARMPVVPTRYKG